MSVRRHFPDATAPSLYAGKYTLALQSRLDQGGSRWVDYTVNNVLVGSLRFAESSDSEPQQFFIGDHIYHFVEIYGAKTYAKDVPPCQISFSRPVLNGREIEPLRTSAHFYPRVPSVGYLHIQFACTRNDRARRETLYASIPRNRLVVFETMKILLTRRAAKGNINCVRIRSQLFQVGIKKVLPVLPRSGAAAHQRFQKYVLCRCSRMRREGSRGARGCKQKMSLLLYTVFFTYCKL